MVDQLPERLKKLPLRQKTAKKDHSTQKYRVMLHDASCESSKASHETDTDARHTTEFPSQQNRERCKEKAYWVDHPSIMIRMCAW
jgi:hypothetical protein